MDDIFFVGSSGFLGNAVLVNLLQNATFKKITCAISNTYPKIPQCYDVSLYNLNARSSSSWQKFFVKNRPSAIFLNSNIRHLPQLLFSIRSIDSYFPYLIITSTAAVESPNLSFSSAYRSIEALLGYYNYSNFLILRPTIIYGTHKDSNYHYLFDFCKRYHFLPSFSGIDALSSPIYYKDLVNLVEYMICCRSRGSVFLSGPESLSNYYIYSSILDIAGSPRRIINFNRRLTSRVLEIFELFNTTLPISSEQVLRFSENKLPSLSFAHPDLVQGKLCFPLTPFLTGIESYLIS